MKAPQTLKNQPARQLLSRCMRWFFAHCPRCVLDHFDSHRSFYGRFLPGRIKKFLKQAVWNPEPDASLRLQLDEFLSHQVENNPSGQVFLIFSSVAFADSEGQRPTRFARELARRGIPVIFAYWRWHAATPVRESDFPGVFCLPIDEFLKDYESLFSDAQLDSLNRVFMMEFPHPSLLEIVNFANAYGWRTVYDVIDDWEEFHKQGQAVWYDRDLETYLTQNADLTTVTQDILLEKMTTMGAERTFLLPNAFEDWNKGTGPICQLQPKVGNSLKGASHKLDLSHFSRKDRITIGYFGHLTSSWFDWPLIVSVAKRRPDWLFQIIGYGMDKRIPPCDNIIFLGKVEHRDLPAYAKNWDVAMIPFQASRLSAAVDPIKIYEYISLGLPTVVTGMTHLESYPGIFTASGEMEFIAAVEKASRTVLDKTTIDAFLSINRWSNRIDALLTALDEGEYCSATSLALAYDGT